MWLQTKIGQFSIVQKDEKIHVRSRHREHLESLLKLLPYNTDIEIHTSKLADYPYRVVINPTCIGLLLVPLFLEIDYPNFKEEITKSHPEWLPTHYRIYNQLLNKELK